MVEFLYIVMVMLFDGLVENNERISARFTPAGGKFLVTAAEIRPGLVMDVVTDLLIVHGISQEHADSLRKGQPNVIRAYVSRIDDYRDPYEVRPGVAADMVITSSSEEIVLPGITSFIQMESAVRSRPWI